MQSLCPTTWGSRITITVSLLPCCFVKLYVGTQQIDHRLINNSHVHPDADTFEKSNSRVRCCLISALLFQLFAVCDLNNI